MQKLFQSLLVTCAVLLAVACNRQTTNTHGDGGYTYTPPKSTDPSVYNPKPADPAPVPVPVKPDTVVIVVETPPVPTTPPPANPSVPVPTDPFAQPEPWMKPVPGTYLAAKMRRSPCYGTCPTYVAAIFSDGTAFFYGERFVEPLGYFQGRVSLEQLNGLIKLSYQNNFYNLAATYPIDGRYIPDLPTTFIHLNSGINQKTITDKGNAPDELDVLEEALHILLLNIQWKPIK